MKDKIFGELEYDQDWERDFEMEIFNDSHLLSLIVEVDSVERTISDSQRDLFEYFLHNKLTIVSKIESALLKHFGKVEKDTVIKDMKFTALIFPDSSFFPKGTFGFLAESEIEPEHGVGIIVNGDSIEIDLQDIFL